MIREGEWKVVPWEGGGAERAKPIDCRGHKCRCAERDKKNGEEGKPGTQRIKEDATTITRGRDKKSACENALEDKNLLQMGRGTSGKGAKGIIRKRSPGLAKREVLPLLHGERKGRAVSSR